HHNSIYLSFIQGGDGHRCRPSFPTRRSSDLAIQAGDALVGLRSNGLHTNGYALARKVFEGVPLNETVSSELLTPHTSYLDDLRRDRKSTRLNSSHLGISYAVFGLKKKSSDLG